jgi:hypothetical protein
MSFNIRNIALLPRLLGLLSVLPMGIRDYYYSLYSDRELLRSGACCRSLWMMIRKTDKLWEKRYKHEFLSGAYYSKEWKFVLWCTRTNRIVVHQCVKRGDLLTHLD